MKRGLLLVCASVLGLSACASVKNNYVPVTQQISEPPLNEVRTAMIGDYMVKQGTATQTRGVYLAQANPIGTYTLSEGFYPQTGIDDKYIYTTFVSGPPVQGMGRVTLGGGLGGAGLPSGIRFARSEQKTCVIYTGAYGIQQPLCDTEYGYELTERPLVSTNNFQQTLIYSGQIDGKVRVSYREFSGNMARAAFSNEAEYDLNRSDIIAYKGARIRVLNADNEKIEYEVLNNFNTD